MPTRYGLEHYRGHHGVTRSLVEGLSKEKLPFNYNPRSIRSLSKTVVVLAGIRTLAQAIELKKKGHIHRLYAGPNIVVFSSDSDSILASPEIDGVIAPSDWVVQMYIDDESTLEGRCLKWPAGVDTDYWKPQQNQSKDQILIYEKPNRLPSYIREQFSEHLRSRGHKVSALSYGSYTHEEYLSALRKSKLMIGFGSDSESQGLAWAEAWSTNVPTLIWGNTVNVYRGKTYQCSTAPYLCSATGEFFLDLDQFKEQINAWENGIYNFSPRAWVLENMSDEICARHLYRNVTTC